MSFLQPLFLIGLLAAALPVLIHMMNRRKAIKRPFPAMRLLMESNKRTARSVKLRQWLLMAARILGVLLLALALAKPFFLSQQGVAADERLPTATVIVLDDSASMQSGDWWERAKELTENRISRARPWDVLAMITTTRDEAPDRLSEEHAPLQDRLEPMQPSDLAGDTPRALQSAAALLRTSELPQRKIVWVTDGAGSEQLTQAPLDGALGARVELVLARPDTDALTPDNLAITRTSYAQDGGDASTWQITASVKNYSLKEKSNIELRLIMNDTVLSAGRIARLGPGEELDHVFMHRQEGAANAPARVELVSQDAYAADDVSHFVFRTRARINALLVNGETSSIADADELFFLMRALNPSRSTTTGIIPRAISPEGLNGEELKDYDVVVLANVSRVPSGMIPQLTRYVEGGGGVMFFAGDQLDLDAYNSNLGELLPKPLRTVKELAKPGDPDAPVKITRFGAANHNHPIFRSFTLPGGETLQSAEVFSYMLFDPTSPTQSEVLLSFKDGAPALLERRVGKGRVLFFATSADIEWSTLPLRSAYLPLTQRAVQYLARRASSTRERALFAGDRVKLDVSGLVQERAVLVGPMGSPRQARHVLEPQNGEVSFTPTLAGVYQVWADSDDAQGKQLEDLSFAVNVAPSESALASVDQETLSRWLAEQTRGAKAGSEAGGSGEVYTDERRVNVWPKLLFLFTLLLLAETMLGTRRSLWSARRSTSEQDEAEPAA